jgi:predicted SAM-dependent methyltransferase
VKLHIGSRKRSEGWKTFDIEPGPEIDFTGDCKDLSQFADGSIEIIYASHVLEHVPYNFAMLKTLKEWFRVLKPGGTVMISVPDLETLCRLFLHPQMNTEHRFHIMRMMFGGQIDTHDFHNVGLDWNFLASYLQEAGFTEVTRVPEFGLFKDTSALKFCGVPISLNVTARRTS